MSDVERFFIPTKPTLIEGFRAFRHYLERVAASQGRKLSPGWYADGLEDRPGLYKDQPHLFQKGPSDAIGPS